MPELQHALTDEPRSAWRRFWEGGDWWRALVLVVVYYGVYQLLSLLVGAVFGKGGGVAGAKGSAADVLIHTALPIVLGALVLLAFAASVGWLRELFGPQSVRGRGWMWVGIAVVLVINVGALLSLDAEAAGAALIGSWLLTGLFVGLAEELLTRGFVVNLMRKAGRGEIAVALVSSALFAAMHAGNFFTSDQGLSTTATQVVYTFFFGFIMYLALRLTGRLIWPILIHASTDPTLFLFSEHPAAGNPFALLPTLSTYLVIITGVVLLIVFIVSERRRARRHVV
jgi:membrane protease YdiL (CAAX protease family)